MRHGTEQGRRDGDTQSSTDALASLLETERRLTEDIARAESEARALTERAMAAVQRMEQVCETDLVAALHELEKTEEDATVAAVNTTAAECASVVQRLDAVPDERITELADAVIQDFLGIATFTAGAAP